MAQVSLAEVSLLLLLLLALLVSARVNEKRVKPLRRKKRDWILPPVKLTENIDYIHFDFIAKIRSDMDKHAPVEYYLTGPGADKPPYNLFVVDHVSGLVRITNTLDREKRSSFKLMGTARYRNGTTAEHDIPLTVIVLDENDNAPYFEMHTGNITEASQKGTFVMQLEGKDDDELGTVNAEISYSIISQEPKGTGHMFMLEEKTGKLFVKEPTLDRETHDFYKLVIKGTDMGGAAGGLTGTGTVEIKVLDINDNVPTLEKSEYTGSVDENVADVVVMKIKALDKDLENTENWLTVFTIAKGNEDNHFTIETDNATNEGILKLVKPIDFEELQNLELGLIIENVSPFVQGSAILMDVDVQVGEGGGGARAGAATGAGAGAGAGVGAGAGADVGIGVAAGVDAGIDLGVDKDANVDGSLEGGLGGGVDAGVVATLNPGINPGKPVVGGKVKLKASAKSYPIKIAVNNVPEGPAFVPSIKKVPIAEDPNETPGDGTVVTVYAAVDPDTGELAEDVNYAKAYDPDNWFTIDEETAEIKLNKAPDRESPFLVNGTYIAKILAITKDMPSKTATGTIAIEVIDANDNCPTLRTTYVSLCSDKKTVYVTGLDDDGHPNAAPFTFRIIPDGTRGSWDVEVLNETSAALHSRDTLWPGSYELQVEVVDAQGLSCPAQEVFTVDVCTCVQTNDCSVTAGTTSSELSAPAIGLLFTALCLLLFIPLLLLFCQCGGSDTIFPDQFSDMPFDTKEHLISYHTEGKGEDKEVPFQSVPIMLGTQRQVETGTTTNFNTIAAVATETHRATIYDESEQRFQGTCVNLVDVDSTFNFIGQSSSHCNGRATISRQMYGTQHSSALYEDIALPDAFLSDYYSQKALCALPAKEDLLEYDCEGPHSTSSSVGCCSLLEPENNLHFLTDLGPKFRTLAEICSPPASTLKTSITHQQAAAIEATTNIVEPVVRSNFEHTVERNRSNKKSVEVITSSSKVKSSLSINSPQPITSSFSKVTNICDSSNTSHSARLLISAQTVVLQQQPVYYATNPALPMQYVVQPHLQNTLVLSDRPQGPGIPGLYLVSSPQSAPGLLMSAPQGSPPEIVFQNFGSSKSSTSPASAATPTILLPVSPGETQFSTPEKGWKITGPNAGGENMPHQEKGEAEQLDPGASEGTLLKDDVLVKQAAPPQGVFGLAAQWSGRLPVQRVTEFQTRVGGNKDMKEEYIGQPDMGGLGLDTISSVGSGQPRSGIGHSIINPEHRQGSIRVHTICTDQLQAGQSLMPKNVGSKFLKGYKNSAPRKNEANRNEFDHSSTKFNNLCDYTVTEKNEITYTPDNDLSKVVKSALDKTEDLQKSPEQLTETSSIDSSDRDNLNSLSGPHALHTTDEQCDTIEGTAEDTMPDILFDKSKKEMGDTHPIDSTGVDPLNSLSGPHNLQTTAEQSDTIVDTVENTAGNITLNQSKKETEGTPSFETTEEDTLNSLPGPYALQTTAEHSDTIVETVENTVDNILLNQSKKETEGTPPFDTTEEDTLNSLSGPHTLQTIAEHRDTIEGVEDTMHDILLDQSKKEIKGTSSIDSTEEDNFTSIPGPHEQQRTAEHHDTIEEVVEDTTYDILLDQSKKEMEGTPSFETTEEDTLNSLPGPYALQTTAEHSDTIVETVENTVDNILLNQSKKETEGTPPFDTTEEDTLNSLSGPHNLKTTAEQSNTIVETVENTVDNILFNKSKKETEGTPSFDTTEEDTLNSSGPHNLQTTDEQSDTIVETTENTTNNVLLDQSKEKTEGTPYVDTTDKDTLNSLLGPHALETIAEHRDTIEGVEDTMHDILLDQYKKENEGTPSLVSTEIDPLNSLSGPHAPQDTAEQ